MKPREEDRGIDDWVIFDCWRNSRGQGQASMLARRWWLRKLLPPSPVCGLLRCGCERLRCKGAAVPPLLRRSRLRQSNQPAAVLQQTAVVASKPMQAKALALWWSQGHCQQEVAGRVKSKQQCGNFPLNTGAITGVPVYGSHSPFITPTF